MDWHEICALQMDDTAFELLDGYEGCYTTQVVPEGHMPSWDGHYFRMACTVEILLDDNEWEEAQAIAYKAHEPVAGSKPRDDYVAHLLAGEPLLPQEWVTKIRELAEQPSSIEEDPAKGTVHAEAKDDLGFSQQLINTVIEFSGCTHERAVAALESSGGNPEVAIQEILV